MKKRKSIMCVKGKHSVGKTNQLKHIMDKAKKTGRTLIVVDTTTGKITE